MNDQPLVLVIDDNADIVMLCQVNLELDGFRTVVATDGEQALAYVEQYGPDALLLDLWMRTSSDGWYVLDALQVDPSWRDIPVVVLSGYLGEGVESEARDRGASAFVPMPFEPASLAPLIRRLLAESSPGSNHGAC